MDMQQIYVLAVSWRPLSAPRGLLSFWCMSSVGPLMKWQFIPSKLSKFDFFQIFLYSPPPPPWKDLVVRGLSDWDRSLWIITLMMN